VSSRSAGLDEETVRAFIQDHYPRIVNGLTVMCGDRTVAEDAVQEALARAWERSERGERIEQLAPWVTVVARNILRSGFRRLRLERRARSSLAEADAEALGGGPGQGMTEDHVDVLRALAGLTANQRETTVLHYYLGMPVAEVARVLGVSEGTVKSTLHRARQILAPSLGVQDPPEGVTRDARR
jgi:RNA polymerase sigma-70 factor, ECF subfamily